MELGYADVDLMMESITARMFSEWVAYESFAGPIDKRWREEILAQIHEAIQLNSQIVDASIPRKKGDKKKIAPKFRRVPRPWEIFKREDDSDETEEEEDEEPQAPSFGDAKRRR